MENDVQNFENQLNQSTEIQPENSDKSDLILGKFKSTEDLANAYQNIQKQSGQQSKELGELRKKAEDFDILQKQLSKSGEIMNSAKEYFQQVVPKYSNEQYFKNNEFNNLYTEAFKALGVNLDTDKFISLLDNYVNARINLHEKTKAAKNENETLKSQMQFSASQPKNINVSLPKLDNLSNKEIDDYVAKHI